MELIMDQQKEFRSLQKHSVWNFWMKDLEELHASRWWTKTSRTLSISDWTSQSEGWGQMSGMLKIMWQNFEGDMIEVVFRWSVKCNASFRLNYCHDRKKHATILFKACLDFPNSVNVSSRSFISFSCKQVKLFALKNKLIPVFLQKLFWIHISKYAKSVNGENSSRLPAL